MTVNPVWHEEACVKTYETDFRQRIKPAGFFQIMQDAAAHHAAHLGFGFESMMSQSMIWILSRVKIVFYHFPVLGEKILIETWPKGIQQKLFFMRDFHLTGEDGRHFASASTAWLLVNPTARRLLMPSNLPGQLPNNDGKFALSEPVDKIAVPDGLPERLTVEPRFTAIDLMGHVANWRYVEWLCDTIPFEEWQQRELAWLQINYVNEVRPGEKVSLCAAPLPDDLNIYVAQGFNHTTNVRAFEAALGWK